MSNENHGPKDRIERINTELKGHGKHISIQRTVFMPHGANVAAAAEPSSITVTLTWPSSAARRDENRWNQT
jgi:hypothetical protein